MQDHASEDIWSTVSKFSLLRKQTRLFNNRCLYKGFCVLNAETFRLDQQESVSDEMQT